MPSRRTVYLLTKTRPERRRRPQLKTRVASYPADEMICWPVSARIGNVKHNEPSLTEPSAAA